MSTKVSFSRNFYILSHDQPVGSLPQLARGSDPFRLITQARISTVDERVFEIFHEFKQIINEKQKNTRYAGYN